MLTQRNLDSILLNLYSNRTPKFNAVIEPDLIKNVIRCTVEDVMLDIAEHERTYKIVFEISSNPEELGLCLHSLGVLGLNDK